ncbi:MAG TPA: 6,7-dimethyl-8-ribityllumazine synthase [Bacteroidia bacterium]|jgi:6,7-dimethyl-8-ribityllumazine synthase|nr:6,7-dimethyl-8-ribityllumazine synthase [Bacteroidia bacterium]
MASSLKSLSDPGKSPVPSAKGMHVAIIVSEWNAEICKALEKGAHATLLKYGVKAKNILVKYVPGSFELPLVAQFAAQISDIDAIICLGCIIRGETSHFDFIGDAVANGVMNVGLMYNKPVVFGVLTTENLKQATERSGGKHGNKGDEAALTAIRMVSLKKSLGK